MIVAMDLNASPLPEDDEETFEEYSAKDYSAQDYSAHEYSAPQEHVESGVDILRREREERRKRLKRDRPDDRPVPASQPPAYELYQAKFAKVDKSRLPSGWLDCPSSGQEIYCMIPSKVPLCESYNDCVPPGRRYSFKQVIHQQRVLGRKLGLVIDLTNTTRYYQTTDLKKEGIKHIKIPCKGRDSVPDNPSVNQFVYEVMQFMTRQKHTKKYILVHCTHGHNRTGYMIIHYLMRTLPISVTQAIKTFADARPPGIYKLIKFMESYYLILVTKRRQIGSICGHAIYSIDESQLITIPHVTIQTDIAHSKTELRYKKLLSSVDLTKDFFYSYTYPIMQSLQKNVVSMGEEGMQYENIFVWNAYLTQAIRSRCNNTIWTIALVHGHFKQTRLSIFGRDFSVSLVSRRSRHFAGTRYLKRGVNDRGRVANDVETEQIILDEEAGSCKGKMSSVVQMRGSIPLFWSQEASRFSPKPDIILQRYDPTYQATKLHFEDLARRYGNPIIVLNLIKTVEKRPREMMLRREFTHAVGYLNQILSEENHLKFIHWDFHKFAKSKSANVLAVLGAVASEALDLTGFYYSGKPSVVKRRLKQISRTSTGREASLRDLRASSGDLPRFGSSNETLNSAVTRDRDTDPGQPKKNDNFGGEPPHFQSGVLRTNCIDCLDRTNVAQYAYGLAALGRQLHAMGLTNIPKVDPDSTIAAALMDMYQSMGDALAQQYGGSAAHNTVFPERQGKWKATTQSREFLKSIKRYYSNAYTDGEKQDAINLFLGYFKPQEGKPALWELDSDYYLHVSGLDDLLPDLCSQANEMHSGALGNTLAPIPACKEDFLRMKLTSFDKLIERTCSSIKNVRLCSEPDQRPGGATANSSVAPDAAEIQLKSPNWLFGQRKYEESGSAPKVTSHEIINGGSHNDTGVDGYCDLNWLSSGGNDNEEDIFLRYLSMTSVDEANGWYGGTLLGDQDESSEIYKHYAELCQGPAIEPFQNDREREKHYADALHMGTINILDDAAVEAEMEAALKEYDQIGSDLVSIPPACKSFAEDPSWLTRWIIGEEKVQRI